MGSWQTRESDLDDAIEDLATLALHLTGCPIAAVGVPGDRCWFRSVRGLKLDADPMDLAFCARTMASAEVLVVPDAQADPEFRDDPIVRGAPFIRFFAGIPIPGVEASTAGVLAVMDTKPGGLDADQRLAMRILARRVGARLAERGQLRADPGAARAIALADDAPCALYALDSTGTLTAANRTLLDWTGWSRSELVGRMKLTELLEVPASGRGVLRSRTGVRRPVLVTEEPGGGGAVRGVLVLVADGEDPARRSEIAAASLQVQLDARTHEWNAAIAAIRQEREARLLAEDRLQGAEETFARSLRLAELAQWTRDVRTDALTWRGDPAAIFGEAGFTYSREEMARRIHADDQVAIAATFARARVSGEPFAYEFRLLRDDGSIRWMEARGVVVAGADGHAENLEGVMRDVTARHTDRTTLRDDERLRSVLESVTDGFVGLDRDWRYTYVNRRAAEFFGREPADLVGKMIWDVFPEGRGQPFHRAYERALAEQVAVVMEEHYAPWDRWFENRIYPSPDGLWIFFQETTERVKSARKLEASVASLHALSGRLQQVREEENARIAREIHDGAGQSLTALKLDVGWLQRRLPAMPEARRPELEAKLAEMGATVDASIDAVRRVSTELRPAVLDDLGLASAVEWQGDEFRRRAGLGVTVDVPRDTPRLSRERSTAMFRALQEALSNVARHANARQVEVSLRSEAEFAVLVVQDDGGGISEREASDPRSIGLLGIRERIEVVGGTVEIRGEPGKGTRVCLRVPLG